MEAGTVRLFIQGVTPLVTRSHPLKIKLQQGQMGRDITSMLFQDGVDFGIEEPRVILVVVREGFSAGPFEWSS